MRFQLRFTFPGPGHLYFFTLNSNLVSEILDQAIYKSAKKLEDTRFFESTSNLSFKFGCRHFFLAKMAFGIIMFLKVSLELKNEKTLLFHDSFPSLNSREKKISPFEIHFSTQIYWNFQKYSLVLSKLCHKQKYCHRTWIGMGFNFWLLHLFTTCSHLLGIHFLIHFWNEPNFRFWQCKISHEFNWKKNPFPRFTCLILKNYMIFLWPSWHLSTFF